MALAPETVREGVTKEQWYKDLANYERPHWGKAIWQLVNTFVPYVALWAAMVYMVNHGVSYWLVLPLILLATGFLTRIFIFFHDCGHGCFTPSRRFNRFLGFITGVLTFTPFDDWRHQHNLHHSSSGDLDRRGAGDVWTMTVEEYLAAPKVKRIWYRIYRNPFVLFLIGPLFLFFFFHRVPHRGAGKREKMSVHLTNLALIGIATASYFTIGLRTYLLIQLPLMSLAGAVGVWLFYVQHQYETVYWSDHENWDPVRAALAGSSYYKLPAVLQWFSGNIGLHHIHHLRARIPNYNLQKCMDEIPAMHRCEVLTISSSLKSMFLNLWDERERRMVSFRTFKRRLLPARRAAQS